MSENYIPVNVLNDWLKYFPMEKIHIINSDVFILEPWTELAKVEHFLNLNHEINEDYFYFSKTKGFYCMTKPEKHCMAGSKGHNLTGVATEGQLEKLRNFFIPYNKELYNLLNVNFGWK